MFGFDGAIVTAVRPHGFDGSPVAHMWRTLIYPDNPL